MDSGRSSINDTYIMTPAESPSAAERKRRLVRLAKKAIKLPSPVDKPARRVSVRASRKSEVEIVVDMYIYNKV